jgi:hypothetical protein
MYTLGVASTYQGNLLPAVIIWPTKGLRNPVKSKSKLLQIQFGGENFSWYNIE